MPTDVQCFERHSFELAAQKGEVAGAIGALQDGRTLRDVAKELGIHVGTAHRWRHRFLTLPQAVQSHALVGIA